MAGSQSKRRQLVGEVVSNKMTKTVMVLVTRRFAHPVYKKYVTRTKRYYVHDGKEICQVGDKVIIEATRPLSKLKRWRVVEVTHSATPAEVEV